MIIVYKLYEDGNMSTQNKQTKESTNDYYRRKNKI